MALALCPQHPCSLSPCQPFARLGDIIMPQATTSLDNWAPMTLPNPTFPRSSWDLLPSISPKCKQPMDLPADYKPMEAHGAGVETPTEALAPAAPRAPLSLSWSRVAMPSLRSRRRTTPPPCVAQQQQEMHSVGAVALMAKLLTATPTASTRPLLSAVDSTLLKSRRVEAQPVASPLGMSRTVGGKWFPVHALQLCGG